MITYVICQIAFVTGLGLEEPVSARGKLINDNQEIWMVDFTEYINENPRFKGYNNLVQLINNNECAFAKENKSGQ